MMRPGEGSLDGGSVALFLDETDIVGTVGPDRGRAGGQRAFDIGHRPQRRVFDLDQFRRVARLQRGFGDDKGDIIADQLDLPADQRRTGRLVNRGPVRAGFLEILAGQAAISFGIPVGAGQDPQHARRIFGHARVDRQDIGHRVGRTQHVPPGLAAQIHVVEEFPPAGQKPGVLFPRHRLPDCKFTHFFMFFRSCFPVRPIKTQNPAAAYRGRATSARTSNHRM